MEFIDSFGLALVAAEAERAYKTRRPVTFTCPRAPGPAHYMSRMRLGPLLENWGIDHSLPPVVEHDVGTRLLELQQFTRPDVDDICDAIHLAIMTEGGSAASASDFYRAIAEVMFNIEHSASDGAFAAMQVLPTQESRYITFAIADTGVGLRQSLSARHTVQDDRDAIRLAFTQGITGTESSRGEGLADLQSRMRRRGGEIQVWTGNVRGRFYADTQQWRFDNLAAPYTGTMIYARWNPTAPR